MLQQNIAVGPDRAPDFIIDRTLTLDAAELWPDPLKCPDWPHLTGHMQYEGQRGRAGAEARLARINAHLNRGTGQLRAPTAVEREGIIARTFKRSGADWPALGIRNLSRAGISSLSDDANLIVEAAHIRGYLRKLDAQERREADDRAERVRADARRTMANYRETAPAEIAEIQSLAEAAARHQQRLEDEKAFNRSRMLRDHVETLHSAAVAAAHKLGLGVPDAPKFE